MDYLNPNSNNPQLFTNSHDPQTWIDNMKILWVIFTINGILRGFTSFATLFWYIVVIIVFAIAIFKRQKIIFGFTVISLFPITIIELMNLFQNFSKPFSYAFLGLIFSLLALIMIAYNGFCCFKMFKQFPEGLDYSQQRNNIQPMNREYQYHP